MIPGSCITGSGLAIDIGVSGAGEMRGPVPFRLFANTKSLYLRRVPSTAPGELERSEVNAIPAESAPGKVDSLLFFRRYF